MAIKKNPEFDNLEESECFALLCGGGCAYNG